MPLLNTWTSQRNYGMAFLAWTVGMTNTWKFPLHVYQARGLLIYLFCYIICIIILGIPMTNMELALGQYISKCPPNAWGMCPIMKGIGYGSLVLLTMTMIYYNVISNYVLFYMIVSINKVLPWTVCNKNWANEYCVTLENNVTVIADCINLYNESYCKDLPWEISSKQYFRRYVTLRAHDVRDVSFINLKLVACSFASQFILFLCNSKGIKSIEKGLYFSLVYPLVALVLLLLFSFLDAGFIRGLLSIITSDFSRIGQLETWSLVIDNVIFSMGIGISGLIMMGSCSSFRNNCGLAAITLNLVDIITSILITIIMYNMFGTLSFYSNIPIEEINEWPMSLMFVRMASALSYTFIAPFSSFLFYSMVFVMAIRAQVMMMATILYSIYSVYPHTANYSVHFSAMFTILMFILNIFLTTKVGTIMVVQMDLIISGPCFSVMAFMESIVIMWFYGGQRFINDNHFMHGKRPSLYLQSCWYLAPLILLVNSIVNVRFLKINVDEEGEIWHEVFSWTLVAVILITLVQHAVKLIIRTITHKTPVKWLFEPEPQWCLSDDRLRISRYLFNSSEMTTEYMYRTHVLYANIERYRNKGYPKRATDDV